MSTPFKMIINGERVYGDLGVDLIQPINVPNDPQELINELQSVLADKGYNLELTLGNSAFSPNDNYQNTWVSNKVRITNPAGQLLDITLRRIDGASNPIIGTLGGSVASIHQQIQSSDNLPMIDSLLDDMGLYITTTIIYDPINVTISYQSTDQVEVDNYGNQHGYYIDNSYTIDLYLGQLLLPGSTSNQSLPFAISIVGSTNVESIYIPAFRNLFGLNSLDYLRGSLNDMLTCGAYVDLNTGINSNGVKRNLPPLEVPINEMVVSNLATNQIALIDNLNYVDDLYQNYSSKDSFRLTRHYRMNLPAGKVVLLNVRLLHPGGIDVALKDQYGERYVFDEHIGVRASDNEVLVVSSQTGSLINTDSATLTITSISSVDKVIVVPVSLTSPLTDMSIQVDTRLYDPNQLFKINDLDIPGDIDVPMTNHIDVIPTDPQFSREFGNYRIALLRFDTHLGKGRYRITSSDELLVIAVYDLTQYDYGGVPSGYLSTLNLPEVNGFNYTTLEPNRTYGILVAAPLVTNGGSYNYALDWISIEQYVGNSFLLPNGTGVYYREDDVNSIPFSRGLSSYLAPFNPAEYYKMVLEEDADIWITVRWLSAFVNYQNIGFYLMDTNGDKIEPNEMVYFVPGSNVGGNYPMRGYVGRLSAGTYFGVVTGQGLTYPGSIEFTYMKMIGDNTPWVGINYDDNTGLINTMNVSQGNPTKIFTTEYLSEANPPAYLVTSKTIMGGKFPFTLSDGEYIRVKSDGNTRRFFEYLRYQSDSTTNIFRVGFQLDDDYPRLVQPSEVPPAIELYDENIGDYMDIHRIGMSIRAILYKTIYQSSDVIIAIYDIDMTNYVDTTGAWAVYMYHDYVPISVSPPQTTILHMGNSPTLVSPEPSFSIDIDVSVSIINAFIRRIQ